METSHTVRTALLSDQRQIESFLKQAAAIHRHLDWRSPLDWLGHKRFILLEEFSEIKALLICTAEPHEVFWVRVFACLNYSAIEQYFSMLFEHLVSELSGDLSTPEIASIAYYDWMKDLLGNNNWRIHQTVIQMRWSELDYKKKSRQWPKELLIRPMTKADMKIVNAIDHECFNYIWQQSRDVVQRAFEQSSYSTVSVLNKEIVGFQISTSHKSIAHLARLAVYPKMQRQYIGQALVHDMLKHFRRPWIREITVNTQQDNIISQNLYKKMGFGATGETYPVYLYKKID